MHILEHFINDALFFFQLSLSVLVLEFGCLELGLGTLLDFVELEHSHEPFLVLIQLFLRRFLRLFERLCCIQEEIFNFRFIL